MPLPANFRTAPGIWIHRDTDMSEAIAAGYERALQGDWSSGSLAQRARFFQALQVERSMLMASLAGTIELEPAPGINVLLNPSPLPGTSGDRRELVNALYGTAQLLVIRNEADVHIETSAGTSQETGFIIAWPVAAIAIAVIVAGAAAIAYCANQAAAIADRQLSRNEDAARLASRDAELMKMVRSHQEKEQQAGKQLPLSEPERLALQGLLAQQHAIASKVESPLDNSLFGGGSSLLSGLGGVALGVAGGFVLSKIL